MLRLKFHKKDIIAIILCVSFIPVYAFQLIIGSDGYLILMLLSGSYVVVRAIIDNTISKSFMFWSWLLLMFWMMLCSYIGKIGLIYSLYYVGKVALWFLANDWYLSNGSLRLLKMARKYVGLLIVITFLQQLIAPNLFGVIVGSGNMRTFFASDNFLGYYYTAYIAVCLILDYVEEGKIKLSSYIMIGICMCSIIISWAVKNMIGIGMLIIYIFFIYQKKASRFLNPRNLIIIFVGIFVGMVFMNVQQNLLSFFGAVFGKDKTFSVRYYLWTQAVRNIKSSPIFGYGIPDGGHARLQYNFSGNARSSHNLVLELTLQGGIVGTVIYFASVVRCIFHDEKQLKKNYYYIFLFLAFNVFLFYIIQMMSGSLYYPFYYMPLVLINNLDKIMIIKERNFLNDKKTSLYCY